MSSEKFWRTAISKVEPNKIHIRGYDIAKLIGNVSFGSMVYLLFTGELPKGREGELIEAILVASCEHSLLAPSSNAVRLVASGGVPLQAAVAAGIISLGEFHGGAIEQCAKMLQEAAPEGKDLERLAEEVVARYRSSGQRILGYGHPVHSPDPRTVRICQLTEEMGLSGPHLALAGAIEVSLAKMTGRRLPLNIDGVTAGVMSDMGIDWRLGKGFFVIARSAGLTAHAFEELSTEKPFKSAMPDEIDYLGPPEREMP